MKIETAKEVLRIATECSREADESAARVKDECDERTSHRYNRLAGKIMGNIFTEVLVLAYEQHPELAPDWYKPGERAERRGAPLRMTAALQTELLQLMDQIYDKTDSLVSIVSTGADVLEVAQYRSRVHEILMHVAEAKVQLLSATIGEAEELKNK